MQEWARQQYGAQGGQYADQTFTFPPGSSSSSALDDGAQQPQVHQQQYQRGQQFLLPQAAQRSRSMSDTSLRPAPVWDTIPGGVRMDDILPGPGGSGADQLLAQQNDFRHPSSAGPHQTTFHNQANFTNQQFASDYLTVEAPGSIRRVKSDSGQRGTHQRQARSLDIRSSNSLSPNSNLLFPPPGPAQQDFMRQFLHPTEPVTSIARGHHRRSSSGSRERGIGGLGMGGMGMSGMGGGMPGSWAGSSGGSARASPYPSPSVSPRPGYSPLPPQDVGLPGLTGPGMGGMGMNMNVGMPGSLSGQMGLANPAMAQSMNGQITVTRRQGGILQVDMPGTEGAIPMTVTRPHVTTPSTAKASHDRRKQPANFACPVPGCGSTFTRHFNLKGELVVRLVESFVSRV